MHNSFILHPHTVRLLTEGDDTRGCGDTIGPPGGEQRAAGNMLRSVVLKNKRIVHYVGILKSQCCKVIHNAQIYKFILIAFVL